MSFYDDASLVFLPSGGAGKDTKAYSIKPTDGSGDFTFSRGSNLTATRVDSNGLIEKGRENLLLQSNQFNTTWTLTNASVTSGQSGYDGSSDAWLLSKSGADGRIHQSVNLGLRTFSIYAKANTLSWIRLFKGGNGSAYFDLTNGVVGTTSLNIDAKIELIGNGWYRCSLVYQDAFSGTLRIYAADNDNDTSGTSGSIYIQDSQLEQGLVATDYIESGATTGLAGLLEDSPRFDYSGGASCPSLLLEPSRTSLYQYSEYIFNFQGTNTFNAANSPEGVSNAVLLTKTSASDQFVNMSWSGSSLSPSTDYTMSLFVKYNGYDVDVRYEYNNFNDWGKGWNALFQVRSSGVTASTTASCTSDVKDYGNGWYRIIVNVTTASSITPTASSNLVRIIGASADEVLIYGAGMEQGSYPTSYIPNHSGGSVTREADYSESSTSLSIGDSEFCAYYEMDAEEIPRESFITFFRIEFGSSSHFIGLKGSSDTTNNIYTLQTLGNYSETMGNVTQAGVVKFLINYSSGTGDLFVNGTKYDAVISGPTTSNTINNVELWGSGYAHNSKQILLFPSALSDAECITLTS